jgi:hypothetical protein
MKLVDRSIPMSDLQKLAEYCKTVSLPSSALS